MKKTLIRLDLMPAMLPAATAWLRTLGADIADIPPPAVETGARWMLWLVPPWIVTPRHDLGLDVVEIRQGEDAP